MCACQVKWAVTDTNAQPKTTDRQQKRRNRLYHTPTSPSNLHPPPLDPVYFIFCKRHLPPINQRYRGLVVCGSTTQFPFRVFLRVMAEAAIVTRYRVGCEFDPQRGVGFGRCRTLWCPNCFDLFFSCCFALQRWCWCRLSSSLSSLLLQPLHLPFPSGSFCSALLLTGGVEA